MSNDDHLHCLACREELWHTSKHGRLDLSLLGLWLLEEFLTRHRGHHLEQWIDGSEPTDFSLHRSFENLVAVGECWLFAESQDRFGAFLDNWGPDQWNQRKELVKWRDERLELIAHEREQDELNDEQEKG